MLEALAKPGEGFDVEQAKADMSYLVNVFSALGSCPGLGIMAHAVWVMEGGEGTSTEGIVKAVEGVCRRLREEG